MRILGKKIRRYVLNNWLSITIGLILTKEAIENAYYTRGYISIGSEWFVLPFILVVTHSIKAVIKNMKMEEK